MSGHEWKDMVLDAFGRVDESVPKIVDGLSVEQLTWHPGDEANSIAWLVWHLARVQDDHMSALADVEQVYTSQGWFDRFGLGLDPADIGFGQTAEQAHSVVAPGVLLAGYFAAVNAHTTSIVNSMDARDLDRIVDERWDPPVTAAVRIVSVINDVTQHVGQAAYVRGLLGAPSVIG